MWVPDANVSRHHADILTVINYYRMFAGGMDVVLFPPVRLNYGGKSDCMVYPNVGVIVRRNGPRQICTKDHAHQVYEGPPNFVLEIESKHGFTDLGKKRQIYEASGVQEGLFLENGKPATWYQLRGGKFEVLGQEPAGLVESRALPGFVLDFAKFREHRWLEMMEDIKRSVETTDVQRELAQEYGM